jgi:hypothetical protein
VIRALNVDPISTDAPRIRFLYGGSEQRAEDSRSQPADPITAVKFPRSDDIQ